MKHHGQGIVRDLVGRSDSLGEIGEIDEKISHRIAVLLDENERLRRIVFDLSSHNQRMRDSVTEPS